MLEVDVSRDKLYEKIPERYIDDIEEYMNHGTINNKMLRYILENNLRGVCRYHRKKLSFEQIQAISRFAYNQVPAVFYGDPESVNHCREVGGAVGSVRFPDIEE